MSPGFCSSHPQTDVSSWVWKTDSLSGLFKNDLFIYFHFTVVFLFCSGHSHIPEHCLPPVQQAASRGLIKCFFHLAGELGAQMLAIWKVLLANLDCWNYKCVGHEEWVPPSGSPKGPPRFPWEPKEWVPRESQHSLGEINAEGPVKLKTWWKRTPRVPSAGTSVMLVIQVGDIVIDLWHGLDVFHGAWMCPGGVEGPCLQGDL